MRVYVSKDLKTRTASFSVDDFDAGNFEFGHLVGRVRAPATDKFPANRRHREIVIAPDHCLDWIVIASR